jgi:hypothetical protein
MGQTILKLSKTLERRVLDLHDYLVLLEDDIEAFKGGRPERLKTILSTLRVLTSNENWEGNGLLLDIAKEFSLVPNILFDGLEGLPKTNPLSKSRSEPFQEYLSTMLVLGGKPTSIKDFIWRLASEDASHSDSQVSAYLVSGEMIFIGGVTANVGQILSIAKNTLMVGSHLLAEVKERLEKDS